MEVDVDVRDQQGGVLAQVPRERAVAQTAVYDDLSAEADKLVARIIARNLSHAATGLAHVGAEAKGA
jgi:membrane fusion protein (multidrug efflux system)